MGAATQAPPQSESTVARSRAAAARVQRKLRVSRTGDAREQEADRVADVVASRAVSVPVHASTTAAGPVAPSISRMADRTPQLSVDREAEEEEPEASVDREAEEEEPEASVDREAEREEPEASVDREAEREEPEASVDREAEREEPEASVDREAEREEPEASVDREAEREEPAASVDREAEREEPAASVDREAEEEPAASVDREAEEEEPAASVDRDVQRRASTDAAMSTSTRSKPAEAAPLDRELAAEEGKGTPLDRATRAEMEQSFGADFGTVRIHTGSKAAELSRRLKAHAFTIGRNVFFNSGKYEPGTARGSRLLAHELTHVVQQGAAHQDTAGAGPGPAGSTPTPTVTPDEAAPVPEPAAPAQAEASPALAGVQQSAEADLPADAMMPPPAASAESATAEGEGAAPAAEASSETARGEEDAGGEASAADDGTAAKGEAEDTSDRAGPAEAAKKPPVGGIGAVGKFLKQTTAATFKSRRQAIGVLAANEKQKTPAETKVGEAEKAVIAPSEEGASRAKASQVETVERAPAPEPNEAATKQSFDAALQRAVPKSLEDMDDFKEDGRGTVVGEAVMKTVSADTDDVRTTYQQIETPPEPKPPVPPETMPAIEEPTETAAVGAGEGVVGEVKAEHTDLSEFEAGSDDAMAKEGIKDEQLDMVDEGELAEAREARGSIKSKAKSGPREVKVLEQEQKAKVAADLRKEEVGAKAEMRNKRRKGLVGARDDQQKAKSKLELERQAVTDKINGIYKVANDAVKAKLADLERRSLADFDTAQKQATTAFENNVKRRMDAFKDRRYSGWLTGSAKWLKDKLFGMDKLPEVKEIFDSERATFVTSIDASVKTITAESKRVVQECRDLVTKARQRIQTFVDGLGPKLRAAGTQALNDVKGKLDALDKDISEQEQALKKKLADKREAAIAAIDKKIEKMKEEMSGLVSKLGNLLLDAMIKFFKWALKKAGYSAEQLMGIINKGKTVIKKIVTDPIAFIGNIVTAVKRGIGLFVTNIKQHLIGGLISWLTGAMADVPIKLPARWDLRGILDLVLQILGLTWDRIRKKLVARVGEKVVKVAETSVAVVKRLIVEGPMALWEMIKEKAADIKRKVIEGIRNWVIVELVKQAVIKLVSFLNPAGAIVQAIIAIYNVVMFFVENMSRIIEFVKTVFDSIGDIAMGRLSAAAKAVEKGMAMTIPIILAFLARLIGLSGIGNTVMKIIKRIRRPIDKVVDKVIDTVAKAAKKLAAKAKGAFGKAKTAVKKGAQKLAAFVFPKRTFRAGKETHTLSFRGKLPRAKLMVASTPTTIETRLKEIEDDSNRKDVNNAREHVSEVGRLEVELDTTRKKPGLSDYQMGKLTKPLKTKIQQELGSLAAILSRIFPTDLGTKENPYPMAWPKPAYDRYPAIWIGPRTEKHLPQATLKAGESAVTEALGGEAWDKTDSPIRQIRPDATTSLPGDSKGDVGIRGRFRLQKGTTFQLPKQDPGGTPGGGKINTRFEPFGFRASSENLDGDHVLEIQTGGEDRFENLWPLDASTNRRAGGAVSKTKFIADGKTTTMSALKKRAKTKDVWLQIVSTK